MHSHHAVLFYSGGLGLLPSEVKEIEADFETSKFSAAVLSIAEARAIIEQAYQKPFVGEYKYIVIDANSIQIEAQNALLKILEEPPQSTRFLLVVREGTLLLPTLRSRLYINNGTKETAVTESFLELLDQDLSGRLETIAKIAKAKDQTAYDALYAGLLAFLKKPEASKLRSSIADILPYFSLRGASKKMLWEDIALRLPIGR